MSLILEALRKSESERRRGLAPDLAAELPPLAPPARQRLPAWSWLVLGSIVMLVAAWLWRDARTPAIPADAGLAGTGVVRTVAPEPAPTTGPVVDAGTTSPASFPPVDRIEPPAQAAEPGAVETQRGSDMPAVATVPTPDAVPGPTPRAAPVADPERRPAVVAADTRLPMVTELAAEERRQLPPLKLSMHMWNERPAERFVILDGTRYGEGDRVGTAVISAIDVDGVRFELNGRAVRLPLR